MTLKRFWRDRTFRFVWTTSKWRCSIDYSCCSGVTVIVIVVLSCPFFATYLYQNRPIFSIVPANSARWRYQRRVAAYAADADTQSCRGGEGREDKSHWSHNHIPIQQCNKFWQPVKLFHQPLSSIVYSSLVCQLILLCVALLWRGMSLCACLAVRG